MMLKDKLQRIENTISIILSEDFNPSKEEVKNMQYMTNPTKHAATYALRNYARDISEILKEINLIERIEDLRTLPAKRGWNVDQSSGFFLALNLIEEKMTEDQIPNNKQHDSYTIPKSVEDAKKALQWFIENDDTNTEDPWNAFYTQGLEAGKKALRDLDLMYKELPTLTSGEAILLGYDTDNGYYGTWNGADFKTKGRIKNEI